MGEFRPLVFAAIVVAAVATLLAVLAGGVVYILLHPLVFSPLLALAGYLVWRSYKRRRV